MFQGARNHALTIGIKERSYTSDRRVTVSYEKLRFRKSEGPMDAPKLRRGHPVGEEFWGRCVGTIKCRIDG